MKERLLLVLEPAARYLGELEPAIVAAFAAAVLLAALVLLLLLRRRKAHARPRPEGKVELAKAVAPPVTGLRTALARTREVLRLGLRRDRGVLDPEHYLAGVEEALLVADVGVSTTQALLARLRETVAPSTRPEDVLVTLAGVLRTIFPKPLPIAEAIDGPRVILVAGVNGVGKTTTIGKLAALQVAAGARVLLVAADTFRAAAIDQLERWGGRVGADVIRQAPGTDPAAVVVDGLRAARARKSDVVFIDTAGRLHTKVNLMEELRKIRRVIDRECPGAPHETLLVLDATTGQNGLQQARVFKEALDVTGVVLTKMDGTARGGIAVAVAADLGLPIRYLALGERAEDLAPFDPEEFIDALLTPERSTPEATARNAGRPEGQST
jgi:fused signal recognition particle receptor